MSTRITNNMISRSVLADLNDVATRQSATRRKMSSGKEITRPSDDPFGAGRALALRGELDSIRQYTKNVNEAQGWMTVTDTALGKIGDLAHRARELVVQGASGTTTADGRQAIAQEIDQLIAGVKQEANATYDGRYVLAGNKSGQPPYDARILAPPAAPNDGYAGDTVHQFREIGPGVTIDVTANGLELLGSNDPSNAQPGLLSVLRGVADHLRDPTQVGKLGNGDISALDAQIDTLLGVRARIGAGMNRLEVAEGRLAEFEESTTSMLSDVEDADMAKTLTDFSTQQAVYQSALNAGARIVQSSLLDFLR